MKIGGDFITLCMNEDCANWIVALIAGCTIIFSILIIVCFLGWRIWMEQRFDRTDFANFGRTTCPVGDTQNDNAQNNGATPANGNVQDAGVPNEQQ